MTGRTREFTIGQVAAQVGVRPSALRYYERVGLLPSARRVSGQRRYAASAVDRLHLIGFAKQAGFRLAEIRTLLTGTREQRRGASVANGWRQRVPGKIAELETELARLHEMQTRLQSLLLCRCRQPEQCGRQLRQAATPKSG